MYKQLYIKYVNKIYVDTIQVKNHRQNPGYKRNWKIDGPGISFILGSWAIKWAYDKGSRKIYSYARWNHKLEQYYSFYDIYMNIRM